MKWGLLQASWREKLKKSAKSMSTKSWATKKSVTSTYVDDKVDEKVDKKFVDDKVNEMLRDEKIDKKVLSTKSMSTEKSTKC
jgi:hypothetical protein